jgi:hypothetical protein
MSSPVTEVILSEAALVRLAEEAIATSRDEVLEKAMLHKEPMPLEAFVNSFLRAVQYNVKELWRREYRERRTAKRTSERRPSVPTSLRQRPGPKFV